MYEMFTKFLKTYVTWTQYIPEKYFDLFCYFLISLVLCYFLLNTILFLF